MPEHAQSLMSLFGIISVITCPESRCLINVNTEFTPVAVLSQTPWSSARGVDKLLYVHKMW